ncbi:MAG: hypothetical protein QM764_03250 [Chitinophagaceae bacterium]
MKHIFNRIILLLTALFSLTVAKTYSQNLTGIWRGYFVTEYSDQYKFEVQIDQKKNSLSGVSYSYLTTVFYGKATLTGNFSSNSQNALIQEIKTVEVKMGPGSTACIMKCSFQYVRSGKEEFLEGTFTSRFEKDSYGAKKGDNCGSGKVVLRKVQSSDFYVEPFLRKEIEKENLRNDTTATTKKPPIIKKATPPKTNNTLVNKPSNKPTNSGKTNPPVVKKNNSPSNQHKTVTKTKLPEKPNNTPVTTIDETKVNRDPDNKVVIKKHDLPTPPVLKSRENNLVQTITAGTRTVQVKIYDNGEIDDDTISVYLDKKLVLSKQRLSASPLIVNIKMDDDDAEHELVMVADNLGRIPPNTSLMVVYAGDKRYEVRITSNETNNAVVRFVYRKPD